MNDTREKLFAALAEFTELFPEYRLGQMICNLTDRAKPSESQANPAGTIWDIEDDELLNSVTGWIERRRNQLQQQTGPVA